MNLERKAAASPPAFLRLDARGLVVEGGPLPYRLLGFVDTVLRGIGQVMLQDNSFTGLLFLVGIFFNSMLFGWAVLVGTAASTVTGMWLGVDRAQVRAGLFGFNGALVAIALLYFLAPGPLAWGYVILAAAGTTIVMAALLRVLDTWKLPALTAPFVVTTLCFILAGARFGRLQPTELLPIAGLPTAATVEGIVTASSVGQGLLTGVAQVFFQGNAITGVFFLAGLLIASRLVGVVAVLGSLAGVLVAWGMGAAEPAIRDGAFGFNCVLTAIALAGGRLAWNTAAVAYVTLAVVTTAIVFAAVSAALEPLGMPALTLPFVLVVWLFQLAAPHFHQLASERRM